MIFLLLVTIFFYILSFITLSYCRKEISHKITEKIILKLENDEKIINKGFYTNAAIIILSLMFAFSALCLFQEISFTIKTYGFLLYLANTVLSLIVIRINFKQIIVLTNKSVFFSYGKEPKIEQIYIKDIENSRYSWCFRPFLYIKLKNGETKVISHMKNLKEINEELNS